MSTIIPQCFDCRHFDEDWAIGTDSPYYKCRAFEKIPDKILLNEHDHKEPYPGDNGIRFEPKDKK